MSVYSRLLLAILLTGAAARPDASAQEGSIRGTVTERGTNSPVPGVNVTLRRPADTAIAAGTYTDLAGRYALMRLRPGSYLATFSVVGYGKLADAAVDVPAGATVALDAELDEIPLNLDAVIVSASRREEKVVAAPGSASVIVASEIAARPSVTPVDHLRSTGGVDIAQTGLMQQTVVTRAFNNVFSTSLTMLTDNRIAAVPSLRANVPAFIPLVDDDLERIEVVRGPGSALYGPNAHNGVVNFITRSPFASRGTTISLAGGNRSVVQAAVRHAGTAGDRFGYKVSAGYFRGKDWPYADPEEARKRQEDLDGGASADTLLTGLRDPDVERFGGEARMDVIVGDEATANLTVGVNQAVSTIELTDIGAAQGKDWRYSYAQSRFSWKSLFVQAFLNASDAGDSYVLRTGLPIVDRSRMFVAQAQHGTALGDRQRLTYGVDLHLTRPVTDGTITGRNEEGDGIDEFGGYLQSETGVVPGVLDLVLATRADHNNRLDDVVFSPRAALVYRPAGDQALRLTWNRAYSTPNTTELFLDIVAHDNFLPPPVPEEYNIDIRGSGIPRGGYHFARDAGGRPLMHSQLSADRSLPMSVDDVALLWPALVQALADFGVDLTGVTPPTVADVGATMAVLDYEAETYAPASDAYDIPGLRPTITNTVELGYKGTPGGAFLAGIDLYHTRVTNFIGQFEVVTPNVFMNPSDVASYLRSQGISPAEAAFYGSLIGGLPVGTVSPEGVADPTALLVTPRNFGRVEIWGADVSLEYAAGAAWRIAGTFSLISKNYFERLDGEADLALNAPKNRGSLTTRYADPAGRFHAEGRARWMSGFRMSSGVYAGEVAEYALFDLNAGAALPWIPGTGFTVSVLNLLDRKHREFVGAPEIGILAIGKIHCTL